MSYPGGEAKVRVMRTTSLHIKDIEQRPTTAYSRDMHDVNEIKQMATHGLGLWCWKRRAPNCGGPLKGLCPDIQHTAASSPLLERFPDLVRPVQTAWSAHRRRAAEGCFITT